MVNGLGYIIARQCRHDLSCLFNKDYGIGYWSKTLRTGERFCWIVTNKKEIY